ncbi:hypothetical protein DPMN_053768 [Dreissena polymorpha]|uniref:Mab-21-like HhH/H2TH-like domain-containing protein n=1 Tax=Dreissena polymorpha TaxID=45954 RepID=A0A9D4CP12_DREPO|nr:hypothetical protein DPMN_053768 [Dreissena polymorpha]
MEAISLRLDEVMEDIGVTEDLIQFRRHMYHVRELFMPLMTPPFKARAYIVGSQIEGSTTIGMDSDLDVFWYLNTVIVHLHVSECCSPKNINTLVIKTYPWSLPQCCSLQVVDSDDDGKPVPLTVKNMDKYFESEINNRFILDKQGLVLLDSDYFAFKQFNAYIEKRDNVVQKGPALSSPGKCDCVFGIQCPTLPVNCQLLFSKQNQPIHWPKKTTIAKAKKCGMFLVAPGNLRNTYTYQDVSSMAYMNVQYPKDYINTQCRMSTNLIERLLMFDLNIVQMRAFILTKMIRKEMFDQLVGDRLCTFHVKTALFFTIENYPENIWRKDNIVQCVLYCLSTLRRFLKRRICPHYIIASVNLFADKLKVFEFQNLIDILTSLISSKLQCILTLNTDMIKDRLFGSNDSKLSTRKENCSLVKTRLTREFITFTIECIVPEKPPIFETYLYHCVQSVQEALNRWNKYSTELNFLLKTVHGAIASIKASACIANNVAITEDIIKLYNSSFSRMHIDNYLKYASMLVCTRKCELADAILEYVDRMLTPDMIELSLKGKYIKTPAHIHQKEELFSPTDIFIAYASKMLLVVTFPREAIHCVPVFLVYEMYRTITNRDYEKGDPNKFCNMWMEQAVVDVKPFLYYLQYLSARCIEKKLIAYKKLFKFTCSKIINKHHCHIETTFNLMGHILELENCITAAWCAYTSSVRLFSSNNAAYWHLFRLLGHYVYSHHGNTITYLV